MTSPAAKMWLTEVRYASSTFSRPRSSGSRPAACEIQVPGRADAARGEEHDVADEVLARGEVDQALAVRVPGDLDLRDGVAAAEHDVALPHLVDQLVDDFLVEELERPRPLIDHRHLHAERGEHRRVLDADHAGADDDHRPRQLVEAEDRVGGRDGLAVDLHAGRLAGHGADGDQDVGGRQAARARRRLDAQRVRVFEGGAAVHEAHVVARHHVVHHVRPRAR